MALPSSSSGGRPHYNRVKSRNIDPFAAIRRNMRIKSPQVRVISPEGRQLGFMDTAKDIALALQFNLDRNINDVFLRVIASAESDSHRAALALTREQRDFVGKRNASFGRRGYDLRQAMEDRLEKLNTIARQ